MDNGLEYLKYFWKEVLYTFTVSIYLMFLNNLNNVLLSQRFTDFYIILKYDSWKPLKYFGYAILLFILGILLIYSEIKQINKYENSETDGIGKLIGSFVAIIVIGILLISIIIFINEPIFQAILGLITCVCAIYFAL